ncbi:17698_t:CDS:10, partial [Acaulospora morrowiae]
LLGESPARLGPIKPSQDCIDTHVGGGDAKGKTINIPWPRSGMCDSDYIYAFNKVVMPIAFEFDPDIVIVSAGFDAAEGDPIGENHVSPVAYGHMTHMLKGLADGKLVLALEGGYNLESISKSALACVKVLLGESPARLGPIKPSQDCIETIHQVIRVQSRYWSCLAPEYVDASEDKTPGKFVVGMIDILKTYRTRLLYKEHKMVPVPLPADRLISRFADLSYCSNNLHSKSVIVFFVHDMSEFRADANASTNTINVSESYMIDTVYHYLETIVSKDYGIIDMDVPPASNNSQRNDTQDLKDLLIYLWDNYVESANPSKVVMIGAGRGCKSLVDLISERDTLVMRRVACSIMIPGTNPVPSINKRVDLLNWYTENSFVILPENHSYWEKKPKKECGKCIRTPGLVNMPVQDMLVHLHLKIFQHIQQRLDSFVPIAESSTSGRR